MFDYSRLKNKDLRFIAEKVCLNEPVSEHDARTMLTTNDVIELGMIANAVRKKMHSNRAYYAVNMNLNYTNICELRCPLCAFSCNREDKQAYLLSHDEIEKAVSNAAANGIDEVHIVGGLNPDLPFEYYTGMLERIKKVKSSLFIVAFTAVEYEYFSRKFNIPLEEVFQRFIKAGLGAIPGGGAEIFAPEVREIISPGKVSGERWLEIMKTAHACGLKTNATMLYNHIENTEHIIDHLAKIRTLQEKTGGFKTFVPLPFHETNTGIRARRKRSTGFDDIRIYATARIFLHSVPHIKALWMYLGEKMAQALLDFGVDDIGATYHNEKVVHAAGARTPDYGSEAHLVRVIKAGGKIPVRTNAGYEPL